MIDLADRPMLGPYVLTRQLDSASFAERWLGLHDARHTSHVIYRFAPCRDKAGQRRFLSACRRVESLRHPHLMTAEEYSFEVSGRPWLVTGFPGDADGLKTLESLLRDKGGLMSADEAETATRHLLEAAAYGQAAGIHHGDLSIEDIIVDRRGSVRIELWGFGRQLAGHLTTTAMDDELARDEARSIARVAYQLLTGLRPDYPLIPADRLVKKLDRNWAEWLNRGLDATGGFAHATEALAALPGAARKDAAASQASPTRTVLGRFRASLRPS